MKNLLLSILLLALVFPACKNSGSDDLTPDDPQLSGTKWRVTYFWDKDKDETNDFNGYTFEFKDNAVLIANLPDGSTKTGQWLVQPSNNTLHFVISGTYALDEMSDYWVILERTDAVLKLKDDNTTHLEELHFKRL